jgi:hypothetical protein
VRNKLLLKLGNSIKDMPEGEDLWQLVEDITHIITNNYDRVTSEVRNLLFRIAEIDELVGFVVAPLVTIYNKMPSEVRNLLFRMAENGSQAGYLPLDSLS